MWEFLAVCPPGLEDFVAQELQALGLSGKKIEGGVVFQGLWREMLLAHLWLRVASRILLRLARFRAETFGELKRQAAKIPWEIWIPENFRVRFRVTSYRSRLYHEGAIRERLEEVVSRKRGRSIREGEEELAVVVRVVKDVCTISLDPSGDLFRRGYKIGQGLTALRENLAAALVLASGWEREAPLLDPFCGTGTIPAEAAMLAAGRAPGLLRRFPFEAWPHFPRELWEALKEKARAREKPPPAQPLIFAADASEDMVSATRKNLEALGLSAWVKVFQCELKTLAPPKGGPGYLVTDPPYGRRVRLRNPEGLYRTLGEILRQRFSGWRLTLIFPSHRKRALEKLTGLTFRTLLVTEHGGLRCAFLKGL
ncbi:class I SAM-dependent RNA methyltransferase [Thermosulfurimonas marina]|uniref:Class I SAM-dependent RNA methyltransferase n=1 Tax=Thermosulfurimonas marina TaxID=2047767 RepID=A0A6H1WT63_9BACT|nr:THUMP domain-containing protein [Thermosulfurimonas marina]QJA06407.1 class I SAM-dependent RNA methyltransferase [Thermosulfurimonas marina]